MLLTRALIVSLALGIFWVPRAGAQLDFSAIQRQAAVDAVMRALADALPVPGTLISEVVPYNSYFVRASGNRVTVSARFLREASPDALAAAVARDLLPDPVYAAIALHLAGFDGAGGLDELYGRLSRLVWLDAWHRANVDAAYRAWQFEVTQNSFNVWSREGYHVMYLSRIHAVRALYEQSLQAYRAFQGEMPLAYAMSPVPAELVQAVSEITAVLRGQTFAELSPWGPRIKAAVEVYGRGKTE